MDRFTALAVVLAVAGYRVAALVSVAISWLLLITVAAFSRGSDQLTRK